MIEKPKLRPVEAFPAQYEDRLVIALRDPQGYAEGIVFVPREALEVLGYFDGEHSLLDIQADFMRRSGEMVPSDQLRQLAEQLDHYHLLDGPAFEVYKEAIKRRFRQATIRRPFHAGAAYEEEPEALRTQINALFTAEGAPGLPLRANGSGTPLTGLVVPHIDLQRGGSGYAHAYKALAESPPADVYVILGVAHAGSEHLFSITAKDFETPLGRVETDRRFVDCLQAHCPDDLFADEISHKSEHSIEFQVIFLQHFLGDRARFQIVPILVGTFHEIIEAGRSPATDPTVQNFIHALSQSLGESRTGGQSVCLIASVDLAHVGQRFGDPDELSPEFLGRVRQGDQEFLNHVLERDPAGLYEMIHKEKDWRKVCGFPALYTFLHVLPQSQGTLLDYQQWADPPTGCSVSFASLAFR